MIAVRLHGPLGEKYGAEHRFDVRSPREALLALDANYRGFRRDFISYKHYALIVDGDWVPPEAANGDPASVPVSREVDIVPFVEGRVFAIVPLLAAVGITGLAGQIIGGLILTALMLGITYLLSPKPKKKAAEDSKKDNSYIFSGPENVTEQGAAVPIVYGKVHVGSVVVSAGLEVADLIPVPTAPPAGGQPYVPPDVPGGEATPPTGGWPPIVAHPEYGPGMTGPQGWVYVGDDSTWDPVSQSMVRGQIWTDPTGAYRYNSALGKFYNAPIPTPPDGGGGQP